MKQPNDSKNENSAQRKKAEEEMVLQIEDEHGQQIEKKEKDSEKESEKESE